MFSKLLKVKFLTKNTCKFNDSSVTKSAPPVNFMFGPARIKPQRGVESYKKLWLSFQAVSVSHLVSYVRHKWPWVFRGWEWAVWWWWWRQAGTNSSDDLDSRCTCGTDRGQYTCTSAWPVVSNRHAPCNTHDTSTSPQSQRKKLTTLRYTILYYVLRLPSAPLH